MDGMGCIIIPWIHCWDIPHLQYNDSLFPPFRHPRWVAARQRFQVTTCLSRAARPVVSPRLSSAMGFLGLNLFWGGRRKQWSSKAGRTSDSETLQSICMEAEKWFLAQLLPKMKLRTSDTDSIDS